jgi:hypothetical protein
MKSAKSRGRAESCRESRWRTMGAACSAFAVPGAARACSLSHGSRCQPQAGVQEYDGVYQTYEGPVRDPLQAALVETLDCCLLFSEAGHRATKAEFLPGVRIC